MKKINTVQALIGIRDYSSDTYNAVSVSDKGCIKNGVGEILYRYWTDVKKVIRFIEKPGKEIHKLGIDEESTKKFKDQYEGFEKEFTGISYDAFMTSAEYYDYVYLMEFDELEGWHWTVLRGGKFIPLKNILKNKK